MGITAAQLTEIRHHVPKEWTPTEKFSDGAVAQAFGIYGTVAKTILNLCSTKLAFAIENPDTFAIPGEYSQSNASGVAALRAKIIQLREIVAAEDEKAAAIATVYQINRVGGPRR